MRLDYLHTAEHLVCRVPALFYRILNDGGEHVGNINLRLPQNEATGEAITRYAGHVGYEVFPQHRGHHYAAHAVKLLVPIANNYGLPHLWITCDPDNTASRRTLELAGAEFVSTLPVLHHGMLLPGNPRKSRYRLATNPAQVPSELP